MREAIFVIKGGMRKLILDALRNKPKTVKRLSKELDKHLTSVSRTIIELEDNEFVKCLNPDDDRFRFYQITKKGKQTLKKISEMEK